MLNPPIERQLMAVIRGIVTLTTVFSVGLAVGLAIGMKFF